MNRSPISVIIAASKYPRDVIPCLHRITAQHCLPSEIIIAGDLDVDVRREVTRCASRAAMPIRSITPGSDTHDVAAGLSAARSEFVTFLSANDIWAPETLGVLFDHLDEHRCAYLVQSPIDGTTPLEKVVLTRGDIDAVLFRHTPALERSLTANSCASLLVWEVALRIAVDGTPREIHGAHVTRGTTIISQADQAQMLRKYAPYLKAQLDDYRAVASKVIQNDATNKTLGTERTLASLDLPYVALDREPGANMIFLISLPRSGSTLLQNILAGHPDIHSLPEPWLMLGPCATLHEPAVHESADYEPTLASRAVRGFVDQAGGDENYYRAVREMTSRLYHNALAGSGARLFLDKTPRYFHIIPALRAVYPGARFVFLLRHPLAVMSSAITTWFDGDVESFEQNANAQDCFDGPALLLDGINSLGSQAICVHYENLVSDPERELRNLCRRLGIGYLENFFHYENELPESDFGDQDNVLNFDQPVADFAQTWRGAFAPDSIRSLGTKLLEHLGPDTFASLGYDYLDACNVLAAEPGFGDGLLPEKPLSADELTSRGESFYAEGDIDSAKTCFTEAVTRDPKFATAHNNLGVIYSSEGDVDRAIIEFQLALNCAPDERNALVNLIECALPANRLAETLESLANYLRAMPDDAEIAAIATQIADALESQSKTEVVESNPPLARAPVVLVPGEAPRITIVTPSYNQGDFLEACIDSILSQNYPNLDYIIMDGGSTDRSPAIIKRYAKYLSYWQSEADDGQYAAIETGLKRGTGEVMAWLNSDDMYHTDALWKVAYAFSVHPTVEWLTGLYTFWDAHGALTGVLDPVYWTQHKQLDPDDMTTVQQESTFWRRALWERAGSRLANTLYYAGDWDLWTRFFGIAQLHTLEWTLGGYRYHAGQKVGNDARGYTVEAEQLREAEVARLASAGISPETAVPAPIRLDDEALIELSNWKDSSLPDKAFKSRLTKPPLPRKPHADTAKPCVEILTCLDAADHEEFSTAINSWHACDWSVTAIVTTQSAQTIRDAYPDIEVVTSDDKIQVSPDETAVKLSALLQQGCASSADYVGIIKPDVLIHQGEDINQKIASLPTGAMLYGDKFAVNSLRVLDGIADGYGYFFCHRETLGAFAAGELTFGQNWWLQWLLMSALANGCSVHKMATIHAYRIRKSNLAPAEEVRVSSSACISSVLAQYLPAEFKTIPSLKLSFDIESQDFEKFAHSFIESRAQ